MASRSLPLASVAFAVFWTAFMWWWNSPMDTAGIVILAITGALAGLGWYWGMSKWAKWQSGRG